MERIYSPIIIRNLKNKTTKRMSLDLSKINKKIIIRQRSSQLFSSNSTKHLRKNNNRLYLTPRDFNSDFSIKNDITTLLEHNLLTNTEIKKRLMSAKNEITKNIYIKLNKLKKNIFRNPSPISLNQNEYKEYNYHNIFQGRHFPNKTEKMYNDLRKIFSYNILPGKNENRYKFVKPKSYIEKDWWYSDRKENISNESKFFSRSFLMPTCSKNHHKTSIIKLNKYKNALYLSNSKENKIYKAIVKKSLLRNICDFKKTNKISNRIDKN